MRFAKRSLHVLAMSASLLGCSGNPPQSNNAAITYYRDVKPIVDEKCAALCHHGDGIAPFTLLSYSDLMAETTNIRYAVANRIMPPWLAAPGCTDYYRDRSLSDAQIKTITDWIDSGAAEGDPADYKALGQGAPVGLSRIDLHTMIPQVYTPKLAPDEYRCFVVDWPETTTKYVSGFGVEPGNPTIVHHVIAYLADPSLAAAAVAADKADPDPGYLCFGGPGLGNMSPPSMLGAWAPGVTGQDFPPGTGQKVLPGSKLIIQIHYNLLNVATGQSPAPDQTAVDFKLEDSVIKEGTQVFWTDFVDWILNNQMKIPAGAKDTKYAFAADPTPYMGYLTNGLIPMGSPFTIYGAGLHMHTRGTHARTAIEHKDGTEECMLDIPRWDFHWQGGYGFQQPKTVKPGDQISLECHWDNSAANQPIVNGVPLQPRDLTWGEGTTDEMCLAAFYVTQ